MWRFVFIVFLITHGLVHLAIWLMPKPQDGKALFEVTHSWLIGDRKALAVALALAAGMLLLLAGVGLWAHADRWRVVALVGLGVSFGLMVVYFNPWYLFIQALNLALIMGLAWLTWPSKAMVGA